MAGRAGRRGIDSSGLVLYLPAYPPLTALEMRTMMTGGLPPLQSRLLLHYDFVLRVLQVRSIVSLRNVNKHRRTIQLSPRCAARCV